MWHKSRLIQSGIKLYCEGGETELFDTHHTLKFNVFYWYIKKDTVQIISSSTSDRIYLLYINT